MRDVHSGMKAAVLIGAASYSADTTPVAVKVADHMGAEILLAVGVGGVSFSGTNKIEFKLEHSNDGTTFEAVTQDDVLGMTVASGGIIKALTAAHAAAAVYRAGYVGPRGWIRLTADFSGTHGTATPLSATAILIDGRTNPQEDQA